MFIVTFRGFLQTVRREFDTHEEAETWLRKIGHVSKYQLETEITEEK